MSIRRASVFVFASFVVVSSLLACSSSTSAPSGCGKDTDCNAGRVCGPDGQCVASQASSTAEGPDACTTDGQCKHVCVGGRCAECRTDDDCMNQGSCYPDGRGDPGCGSAPCVYDPGPIDKSPWVSCDTSTNTCKCTGFYGSGLSCTCEWR
jgi:hypothetical protein